MVLCSIFRLYRKFFYLDAHFHFQFLGLANIVWDMVQILVYFVSNKVCCLFVCLFVKFFIRLFCLFVKFFIRLFCLFVCLFIWLHFLSSTSLYQTPSHYPCTATTLAGLRSVTKQ